MAWADRRSLIRAARGKLNDESYPVLHFCVESGKWVCLAPNAALFSSYHAFVPGGLVIHQLKLGEGADGNTHLRALAIQQLIGCDETMYVSQ